MGSFKKERRWAVLTDNVIAILIPDQSRQLDITLLVWLCDRIKDLSTLLRRTKLNTLLDDVAGKFVLREMNELGLDQGDDTISIILATVFNDVLRDVISILVSEKD